MTGFGPGQWQVNYRKTYKVVEESRDLGHAHNNFLHIAAESGLIGVAGFMAFLLFFLAYVGRLWVKERSPYDLAALFAVAAYATVTDIALAAGLNFFFIHKYIGYKPSLSVVIKTVFASTAMGIFIYFLYHEGVELGVSPVVNLIVAGVAGSLLYILLMFACGGLNRHDMAKLPFARQFFSTEK